MALIVRIYVNENPIAEHYAVRVDGGTEPDDINTYQLDTGKLIKHRYGDGAHVLATEILRSHLPPLGEKDD